MRNSMVGCCAIALSLCAVRGATGTTRASLQTEQTSLELQADAAAPRLLSCGKQRGQIWVNEAEEALITSVEIDGRSVPIAWKFNREASHTDGRSVAFVYESSSPRLRLSWEWKVAAAIGPIEHAVHIRNLESKEVWLPLQDSFRFRWRVDPSVQLEQFYVEKGADKPSPVGTHRDPVPVGHHWIGTSSSYAHPAKDQPREIIPWFAVQNASDSHSGWYVGIEFSGRTRLTLDRDANTLHGSVGLNPDPGPFRTRLKPDESFDTPTVFVGAFHGGIDALGNVLRPWVRQVLNHPRTWENPNYPTVVNNTWGSGMQVNETLAKRMIRDSAELGMELLGVDAGWFRGVGDWHPDPTKFPNGLASIADDAHQHGLRFGIWVDWVQAALGTGSGALNVRDPKVRDWIVSDLPEDWKPEEFKGESIDIGAPAARAYAQSEVFRMVEDYHLDMLEHDGYVVAQGCVREDHPHAPPDRAHMAVIHDSGFRFVESANSTDVSYHATRAYYAIHENLRRRHPDLLLEICNDGGRMVDFGSAAHGDYFSITDTYDPVSNRRAFYDTSHVLPAAMLEAYVAKWPTPRIENFRYMLRSGMMGWLTIMLDTNAWSEEQHAAAKEEIRVYKAELRALVRDANLYHIAPRPDGVRWDGLEYFDPRRDKGVVYAFRGSTESEGKHVFQLQGLEPERMYQLRFHDRTAPDRRVRGRELLDTGLALNLANPHSSELVFIDGMGSAKR